MAISPLKPTSPGAVPPCTEPPAVSRGGLSWLWLLSDRAMIGAARVDPGQAPQADFPPGADVERSWALAERALNRPDS